MHGGICQWSGSRDTKVKPIMKDKDRASIGKKRLNERVSGKIPTWENPVTRLGIEPGSPWLEASSLTAQPLWPLMMEKYFRNIILVAVAERLACSPPSKANRVQSPAGSLPYFRKWESCRTMLLVGGFLGDLSFPPTLHSGTTPYLNRPHRLSRPCC
ncbi:hypothetical protein PR048_014856 [Dryococelus australis]|uniref:Uncharacterized protein n=1 Tax=Dryococelus australis TaxID=614101 RepID=A0ABQ9HFC8_9NEOP|nr:hypothetical protein PR048_014856 [Dryococelus australis]